MSRIASLLKPPPKPDSFTEAEIDWAYRVNRRILWITLVDVWFVAAAAAVVSLYLLDDPIPAIPAVLLVAAVLYTAVVHVRWMRRLDEAYAERRDEFRAFVERSRAEPS